VNWRFRSLAVGITCLAAVGVLEMGAPAGASAQSLPWYEQALVPTNSSSAGVTGMSCPSTSDCVAVGYSNSDSGLIYTTTDSGASWNSQTVPADASYLQAVSCSSIDNCVAVTNGSVPADVGNILTTSDGGISWTSQTMPNALRGTNVSCVAATTDCSVAAYDSSGDGYILTTSDGGTTWTSDALNTTASLFGISCASSSDCVAVGFYGQIFTTTDGWSSWTLQAPPGSDSQLLYGVSCVPSTTFCMATDFDETSSDELALISEDGGSTWTSSPLPAASPVGGVSCPSATDCVLVGDSANEVPAILATSDGGSTWDTQALPISTGVLASVSCASPTVCESGGSTRLGDTFEGVILGGTAPINPPPSTPEVPNVLLLPASALVVGTGAVFVERRRRRSIRAA
jgi:photosystem II stability/assembly factor-like uncharacterized protein